MPFDAARGQVQTLKRSRTNACLLSRTPYPPTTRSGLAATEQRGRRPSPLRSAVPGLAAPAPCRSAFLLTRLVDRVRERRQS